MLKKKCRSCSTVKDCVYAGLCIRSLAHQFNDGVRDYPPDKEYHTEYTDAANITDTILPHIEDTFDEGPSRTDIEEPA